MRGGTNGMTDASPPARIGAPGGYAADTLGGVSRLATLQRCRTGTSWEASTVGGDGELARGHEAVGRLAWADAYTALSMADQSSLLAVEDLELLATAALQRRTESTGGSSTKTCRITPRAVQPGPYLAVGAPSSPDAWSLPARALSRSVAS